MAKDFSQLPEGFVSEILSLTSPRDACRSSAVCSGFKTAAESDVVWGKFLPSNYLEIRRLQLIQDCRRVRRGVVSPLHFTTMTKKEIYFSLCSPILLDRGKLVFEIDRESGKKCYTLPAPELSIAWQDSPLYWWKTIRESRFSKVAKLRTVCWLDIMGKLKCKMLSPKTTYTAYLIFHLTDKVDNFDTEPMKAFVEVTRESESSMEDAYGGDFNCYCLNNSTTVYLHMKTTGTVSYISGENLPVKTRSGWMEIELGDFYSSHLDDDDDDDAIVTMRLMEIEKLWGKAGLIVEGIQVRPKRP